MEETHLHMFDAFCPRQSTLTRALARPAPRPSQASAMTRARAYKTLPDFDCTFPRTLKPHRSLARRRLPVRSESAAAQSLCHRSPASGAVPNSIQLSEKTVHTSVKLPEQGIGVCFAGEASSRSPELSTPPEYVDRVNHSTILRFLVHTVATCDTQFPKGREIEDYYFFSLFSLPGPVLQGFGTFRKHSLVKQ
jgi:hypothetical protein